MTDRHTTPGVHIDEVALRPVIEGVGTDLVAFVGRAARGPVDAPALVTSFSEFERTFGGLWDKSDLGHSIRDFFDNGGRRAIVVRVHRPQDGDTAQLDFGRGDARLRLSAANPGAWGRRLEARIDAQPRNRFDLTVTDRGTGLVEVLTGLSLAPGSARRVDRALEESSLIRALLPLPTSLPSRLPVTAGASGGGDGARFGAAAYIGPGMREARRGIYALDRADLVNLIVLPPYAARGVSLRVLGEAITYAGERRAMTLLDPPASWLTVADAVARAGSYLRSSNAALYFPRLRRPGPSRSVPGRGSGPAGAVAGMLARLDLTHGFWRSPAGRQASLSGATPAKALTAADIERLNPLGVNCIRSTDDWGTVVWGARTRAGPADPEWKYVNVRRTALFLEESIDRGLQWAVFEPNRPALWSRVLSQVDGFLYGLYRQGALTGNRPQDAYFVRCGPETMTQDDIDLGRLIVLIGFAPIKPAEFLLLRIGMSVMGAGD